MKRRFVTSICAALLVWATFDDVLAAQTAEPDDDLAAALDNDCVRYAPVKAPSRAEIQMPVAADIDIPLGLIPTLRPSLDHALLLADALYMFMSLQR